MKSLVVYYSRGGNTRQVAQEIAAAAGADSEELVEEGVNRGGVLGWILAGRDGARKAQSRIMETSRDPSVYDLIFIGSPVWAGNLAQAVRAYLTANKLAGKKAALFCTCGSSPGKAFESMRELTAGCDVAGELAVKAAELKDKGALEAKLKAWAADVAGKA